MKQFEVTSYRANSYGVLGEKCSKCNDKRMIVFASPTGKELSENCSCGNKTTAYRPEIYVCQTFEQRNGKLSVWYEKLSKDSDGYRYNSSNYCRVIYDEKTMLFEDLERYETYFRTEEDCQKYCDWLTANEKKVA